MVLLAVQGDDTHHVTFWEKYATPVDCNLYSVPKNKNFCGSFCMGKSLGKQIRVDEAKSPLAPRSRVVTWYWEPKELKGGEKWVRVPVEESQVIESEYQAHLRNDRSGQRVYHCFGDGRTAHINFKQMQTVCGSGRCQCFRGRDDPNHMTFNLLRGFCT